MSLKVTQEPPRTVGRGSWSVAAGAAKRELGVSLRLLPDPRGADPHRSRY